MRASPIGQLFAAILYGAIALTANTAAAGEMGPDDVAVLKELSHGEMANLVVRETPRARIEAGFYDLYGNPVQIADFAGKVVLVNFWATWCPPCREEMPSIDALAEALGGEDFEVVAISTDRAGAEHAQGFFDETEIRHLKLYHDRSRDVARQAGVLGLPVSLILDRQGREVARMIGDANWSSADARAVIRRIIEMTGAERV